VWLGRLLLLSKQLTEAEQQFRRAVELAPGDIRSWNGLFSYYVPRSTIWQKR
jgi:Flp pilus assembly protein TadD